MALAPPPGLSNVRLEALLGCKLENLTFETIHALVASSQLEDQVLDFKRQLDADDLDEVAKDVVALANADGGALVIGVATKDERAVKVLPVDCSDGMLRRIQGHLLRWIAPAIPDLWVVPLHESDATTGVLVIVVPASQDRPHGVFRESRETWWPQRNGTGTVYLRETDLAAAYARRNFRAETRLTQLSEVHSAGMGRLHTAGKVWLAVTSVPSRPGKWRTEKAGGREWLKQQLATYPIWGISPDQACVLGRRSVVHSNEYTYAGTSSDWHLEYLDDGSAFAAVQLAWGSDVVRRGGRPHQIVQREQLESWSLLAIALAAQHALRARAGGELLVRAQLISAPSLEPSVFKMEDGSEETHSAVPIGIHEPSSFFLHQLTTGSLLIDEPSAVDSVVPLAVAESKSELVASTATVVRELLAEFNAADRMLLKEDGSFDRSLDTSELSSSFRGWADASSRQQD